MSRINENETASAVTTIKTERSQGDLGAILANSRSWRFTPGASSNPARLLSLRVLSTQRSRVNVASPRTGVA